MITIDVQLSWWLFIHVHNMLWRCWIWKMLIAFHLFEFMLIVLTYVYWFQSMLMDLYWFRYLLITFNRLWLIRIDFSRCSRVWFWFDSFVYISIDLIWCSGMLLDDEWVSLTWIDSIWFVIHIHRCSLRLVDFIELNSCSVILNDFTWFQQCWIALNLPFSVVNFVYIHSFMSMNVHKW